MNYNPSTQERIGDLERGMLVETGIMANTTYMVQTQQEIFNVYGAVLVIALFGEVTTIFGDNATTIKFNFTSTTPAVAAANLSAASGALNLLAQGARITCVGDAVTTATAITASAGVSYWPTGSLVVGTVGGTGTIGILTAVANQTSGACKFAICYVPLSEGAYVTAAH